MNIVILGNTKLNYSWFVLTHREGFELNGHDVKLIDYKTNTLLQIKRKLIDYKADFVFTHLTFHDIHATEKVLQMFSELNKKQGIKFIHSCGDARREDRYMGEISEAFTAGFVGTKPMVDNCQPKWKIPVYYSPYSSLTYNNIAEPIKELAFKKPVFTGSPNSHKDRTAFIKLLQEYGTVKIFKTQSNDDLRHRTPELSSSAYSILGLCTGYDIDGYMDVRFFQYMGTGACFIARKFKGMDDIIPDNLYYPFNDYSRKSAKYVKDLSAKVLKDDTWPMRCKAFRFMQQNHSSKIRMKQILDVLEGKRKSVLWG